MSSPTADRRDRAAAAAAFALGQRHEAKGELELARQYYEAARNADPGYLPILIRLSFLDFRAGRYEEGIGRLEAGLQQAGQRATIHSLLAFAYLQTGKLELAEAEAMRSWEADPGLAANYRILASIYRDTLRLDQIDELARKTLEAKIEEAEAWVRLGDTFGQILLHHSESVIAERIRPYFEKAVALDPQSAHAQLRLGETLLR
ncbi:MAG: tetratricopeptide repeat protein, partial [Verrucomicrobiia bacterium]